MSTSINPSLPIEDPVPNTKEVSNSASLPSTTDAAEFLGIRVHFKTIAELQALVAHVVGAGKKAVIANHNLHSLYLFHRQPQLRDFYAKAEWIHIDGMPIVSLARLFGYSACRDHRVTYADWFPLLLQTAAAEQWRVFYLGSAVGVADRGAEFIQRNHPRLQIRTRDGYFNTHSGSAENESVLQAIADYQPHLLLVGMGMPRQELWIHENRSNLCANVILPAGAAMDYVAGAVRTPPRWAGRMGLEWAFRLLAEPRRLWHRYLLEPLFLAGILTKEWVTNPSRFKRAASPGMEGPLS
ncbi:MAG TPA: WecB/TagA/CpsF family glycosyltransferase [Candidatus Acidoferrales bacterium]|jgi:N-acetylglucosaminyldiphosphoundecaprenol N-acetyl-beta-D-mannosaminyltransferase|nr:WecB/TagA/CpsF family glycosyltransferase [Candidatus Acidoferrales bacterium]